MWNDSETDVVYVSSSLKRYMDVYVNILYFCRQAGIGVGIIDSKNIWIRDFAPIQVGDRFVKFRYKTIKYEEYPQLHLRGDEFNFIPKEKMLLCDLILDGGNCVRIGEKAFITKIVFDHNLPGVTGMTRSKIHDSLESVLEAEVVMLPVEPGDDLGHSDGIVKPIGGNRILINDYSRMRQKQYDRYLESLTKVLLKAGMEPVLFPYAYQKTPQMSEKKFHEEFPGGDDWNPGFGYYVNFLRVGNLALLPMFGIEEDAEAVSVLRRECQDVVVKVIDCSRLSMEGGLLNCVTANYKRW